MYQSKAFQKVNRLGIQILYTVILPSSSWFHNEKESGMFRLLKRYQINAPYDGIIDGSSAENLKLDPVEVAGQLRVAQLHQCMQKRGLLFSRSLELILSADVVLSAMLTPLDVLVAADCDTAPKWVKHIEEMTRFVGTDGKLHPLLEEARQSDLKYISKYFAVPKSDGLSARSIMNLNNFSKLFEAPERVHLPDIESILEQTHGKFWIVGDFRHYFHQFKLPRWMGTYFGVRCRGKNVSMPDNAHGMVE